MNMRNIQLNPNFYSKIQKNNKIVANSNIFEKNIENFATLKKTSPNEHPRHRFVIFHKLRYVKGGAKKWNTYNFFLIHNFTNKSKGSNCVYRKYLA